MTQPPPISPGDPPQQPQQPQQPYYPPPPRQGDIVGKTAIATTTVIAIVVGICVFVPLLVCAIVAVAGSFGGATGQ